MFSWCLGQGPALSKILARIEMIRPSKMNNFADGQRFFRENRKIVISRLISFFPIKPLPAMEFLEPVHKAGPEFRNCTK